MPYLIDSLHYRDLAEMNPEEVCRRALCEYDPIQRHYRVQVWGDRYAVCPHEERIFRLGGQDETNHDYFNIFLIHYLLQTKQIEIKNEWISEKDIPGGATFFRGPHEIPTQWISQRYGNRLSDLGGRCSDLHGIPFEMADLAYRFQITPRIPVAVLYWEGDEAFLPEAKILYDSTICDHFAPDVVFALAYEICFRLGK